MNQPTSASRTTARRLLAHLCIFALLLSIGGLVSGGCGCRNRDVNRSRPAQGLAGQWTATLNPDAVPIEIPMVLRTGAEGALMGSVAGVDIEDGATTGAGEGATAQFTTGTITVQGPTGEITAEGPLQWSGTLRDGTLDGRVVGPDGRSQRWTARR